ncbi:hypothetical protein EPUL_005623, partial [Erysiphe pulchra]
MAIIKDVPNKVSNSTQPAILSRKSYDENKNQDSEKHLSIYEEICVGDEQNISSYMKDSATEIISMYENASLFLSYQNTVFSDFDSPFVPKSDSTYSYIENLTYSNHQSQSKNDTCPRKSRSHCVYPMQLKQYTYQSISPVVAKERNLNHSNSEDTEIEGPIFREPLKLLSIFPLDLENSLPSLVSQSDEKENFYSQRQILSPLDSSPFPPILDTRKLLGNDKPIRKEDMMNLDMSEIYTSSQASMINFYASIPSLPSFVPRKLQLVSSNHHNYAEDSCSGSYMHRESLSYSTQPLLMSLKDEKIISRNSFKVSNTFHNSSEASFFADRSSINLIHFGSFSIPQITQKSLGIITNDSCVKFPIHDNKENPLDIRESKYERYSAHDSQFELSSNSNKCFESHRTSYTTIDQIEMDLNSKRNEISPQTICCESLKAPSLCESASYTTSSPDTLSKKSQSGQIYSNLKKNQKYGSLRLFKPQETKNAFREAACSKIFSRIPSSQLASKSKVRTSDVSSSKTEASKNPPLLISIEKDLQYGLKIDDPDITPLGSDSLNQRIPFEISNINCVDKSTLNSLPENQDCKDLEYDNFAHNQESCELNKKVSLATYDYNLNTPKLIPSIKQMKLKKSRPQLMKPLPSIPAVGYITNGKTCSIKDKFPDLELSLRFSPWLAGSETSSLKTESGESSGLKFSLPLTAPIRTDVEVDKKTAQETKPHFHDTSDNNHLKRSPPKLRLKAKKLQSFSSCPSISGHSDSIPQDGYSTATDMPNTNLDLEKSKILKSAGLRLKYLQAQSHSNGTVRIKKAPSSMTSTANLPHYNPSDLFTSHDYSKEIFGEIVNDLQLRRPSLDSDNLITSLPVSNVKTSRRKRIKKKENLSGSPKGYLRPINSSNIFESRLDISDDGSQIENYDEMKKKFENLRYRREPLYTTRKYSRSKDEIQYRSPNNLEFHSIKTPKSTPNLHRKYFESISYLKKEPQGQNLKTKIRDWIKSARSAISTRIESQAKVWRKKNEVLKQEK